ncbi:MAG: hypothetical protein K0B01_11455 [Syntrophobacterales bacterium]|nr:hypothetical protein [Syntrophobacterales bacterium]
MGTLTLFRGLAIILEVAVLTGLIYSIVNGARDALFDYGLDEKYSDFIRLMVVIVVCIALTFFVAHLITFYPRVVGHI